MADADFYTTSKPQNLAPQLPPNPSKFYTHFMYKAIIVSIFLLVVPLFPSQAPDFINQTLNTRSWELLQLLFVGVAVSYGLFSKRRDETEKEHGSKFDSDQSYVAGLLQVSSIFDDESENPSGSDDNKVQTWNSQYYRGEPMVVVAQENSVLEEQSGTTSSQTVEKPLLLPVRSLKNGVSESGMIDSISTNESIGKANSLSRSSSKSNSKRFSNRTNKSRNGEFRGVSPEDLEEKVEENVVFRSPIPWRSRSGRMEVKEDLDGPPLYTLPPSPEDSEVNRLESRSFRYQPPNSSRPISNSPSPNKFSPSTSLSSEMQAKSVEDVVKKKFSHKSSFQSIPPPPPPPPPPHFLHKSPLIHSKYTSGNGNGFAEKELKRSMRSLQKESSRNETEDFPGRGELRVRTQSDASLMGKSIRTMKDMELGEDFTNDKGDKRIKEFERNFVERRGYTDKFPRESVPSISKQTFTEYPKEQKKEFVKKIVMETEDESEESEEDEDDKFEQLPNNQEMAFKDVSDMGPDVDKKADEFIAKFREQIRLQRIASIRRSTGQIPKTQ